MLFSPKLTAFTMGVARQFSSKSTASHLGVARHSFHKRPLVDVYLPIGDRRGFSDVLLQVEKIVKNAKSTAGASGFPVDVGVVFAEDALFSPHWNSISCAKKFADSVAKVIPSDIFFAVAFNVFIKHGTKSRNEGFLVTQDGWRSSPKREYTLFDSQEIVNLFGKCNYREMANALVDYPYTLPKNLNFCEKRKVAGVCGIQNCVCFKTENSWIERANKLQGTPFLSAVGKSGFCFEYRVCGDVRELPEKPDARMISLVSAYGLSKDDARLLAEKRRVVLVNDSHDEFGISIVRSPQSSAKTSSDSLSWGCKIISVS